MRNKHKVGKKDQNCMQYILRTYPSLTRVVQQQEQFDFELQIQPGKRRSLYSARRLGGVAVVAVAVAAAAVDNVDVVVVVVQVAKYPFTVK